MLSKDQISSSLNTTSVNEYIKFLLTVTRKNQKIIHASVNDILYSYVISRCTQLNCSISEYIKRLIIKDMLENGSISIPIQIDYSNLRKNILTANSSKSERNEKQLKAELISKIKRNHKSQVLDSLKKEYQSIKKEFTRISKSMSLRRFDVLQKISTLRERINVLLQDIEKFIKKYEISDIYDELDEMITDLTEMLNIISSYIKSS